MAYTPGDIGLCRGTGLLDRLIETGERLHGAGPDAVYSHAFIVATADGGTIEAQAHGVVRSTVASHGPAVTIFAPPPSVDRATVVAYATGELGVEYGYWDDVLLGLDCLLHTRLHERGDSLICSELAALALQAGGMALPIAAALMMPSDIAHLLGRSAA